MYKVFVYWNLHKKCWSVRAEEGPRKGKVIGHRNYVYLEHVSFKVSEAGRQRVIREKRKNVHAGAVGYELSRPDSFYLKQQTEVTYNPYKYKNFVRKTSKRTIRNCYGAYLSSDKRVFSYA